MASNPADPSRKLPGEKKPKMASPLPADQLAETVVIAIDSPQEDLDTTANTPAEKPNANGTHGLSDPSNEQAGKAAIASSINEASAPAGSVVDAVTRTMDKKTMDKKKSDKTLAVEKEKENTRIEPAAATTTIARGAAAAVPAKGASSSTQTANVGTVKEKLDQLQESGALPLARAIPSWMISALVHMVLLILFGMLVVPSEIKTKVSELIGLPTDKPVPMEEELLTQVSADQIDVDAAVTDTNAVVNTSDQVSESEITTPNLDSEAAPLSSSMELDPFGPQTAPNSDLAMTLGGGGSDLKGLAGRTGENRTRLAIERGGTPESEAAVALALEWFANHQRPDGSWSFEHSQGPCRNRCRNDGALATNTVAATSMALLPFLGAGQTHKEGKYKKVVEAGLYFLGSQMKISESGGSLMQADGGGSMYSHGLASIVICEAYAMTEDRSLANAAQQAINFIQYAQDPVGGGWRYSPQSPGDTSVVGWQLMALKSGHMAYLQIDPRTIKGCEKFLDSVQVDYGSGYGYTDPGNGQATTAVGLLCRMYLGWNRDHPALKRGVLAMSKAGPDPANMYYNYYATQVMRHYDGPEWEKWNAVMRDQLVGSQSKQGHEKGSWFMPGDGLGAATGGRIYCTSMSTMILEVYYRHMPLYQQDTTEDEFE